jgi:hypothetical protein
VADLVLDLGEEHLLAGEVRRHFDPLVEHHDADEFRQALEGGDAGGGRAVLLRHVVPTLVPFG